MAAHFRECEHLCQGRNCINPNSGVNSWKFGRSGSHKPHMRSQRKHPQCNSTCPAFSYISISSKPATTLVIPCQTGLDGSSTPTDAAGTCGAPCGHSYRLLVVFSVEHRLDKLSHPDAPSTNWTRSEMLTSQANELLDNSSISGFVSGPLHEVRPGVVSIHIHDRVSMLFHLCANELNRFFLCLYSLCS
jgi:hypothetical protein